MNFFATRQADSNLGLRHIFERNRSEAHRPFFILTAGGCSTWPPKPLRMAERIFLARHVNLIESLSRHFHSMSRLERFAAGC